MKFPFALCTFLGAISLSGDECFQCSCVGEESVKKESNTKIKDVLICVNKNVAPDIVMLNGRNLPIYQSKYDWIEEARVRVAIAEMLKNEDEMIWEKMLSCDDARYSVCMSEKGPSYSIWTAKKVCRLAAEAQLTFMQTVRSDKDSTEGDIMYIELERGDLLAWRKERPNSTLWQLQAESCEIAMRRLSMVSGLTREAVEEKRRQLADEVAGLRRTMKPRWIKRKLDGFDLLTEPNAIRLREQHLEAQK